MKTPKLVVTSAMLLAAATLSSCYVAPPRVVGPVVRGPVVAPVVRVPVVRGPVVRGPVVAPVVRVPVVRGPVVRGPVVGPRRVWRSDSRLKTDIHKVGESPSGVTIYSFKYKDSEGTYHGVMAQEVPWAASVGEDGFLMVDYSKVDVEFKKLD